MKPFALLLLLLVASPAYAQDAPSLKLPATAYLLSAAADQTSAAYGFAASPHIGESNPVGNWIRQRYGSTAMFAAGAAADVAGVWAVQKWVAPKHPRLARALFYGGTAARVWFAVGNVRLARRLTSCRAPIPQAC